MLTHNDCTIVGYLGNDPEMRYTPSGKAVTTFSVGVPYHFVVTNKGAVAHEFVIMPLEQGTQGSEAQLPSTALAGIAGKDLPTGATKTLDYTFTQAPAGGLEFACHLPGHYEAGMHTPITVK